jgi:hypothetical protein
MAGARTRVASGQESAAVKELQNVRSLLILILLKLGASADEIGIALGVTGQRIRQLVPSGKIKRLTGFSGNSTKRIGGEND